MKILILNGSPRPHGRTAAMVEAFARGARESGHQVHVVPVCQKNIAGCLACEYCHKKDSGHERQCVQKDDMQEVYPILDSADMIVLASPIYYHGFSGQLQCAINCIYALDKPRHLKRAALLLSSRSDQVYDGAVYEYRNSFLDYLKLEDMGIYTVSDEENQLQEKLEETYLFGKGLESEQQPPFSVSIQDFLAAFSGEEPVRAGTDVMRYSGWLSNEAMKLTMKLNTSYHTPEEIREILSELTGKEVDETVSLLRLFIQTAERISALAGRCLSTADAAFRIREVLQLAMEH